MCVVPFGCFLDLFAVAFLFVCGSCFFPCYACVVLLFVVFFVVLVFAFLVLLLFVFFVVFVCLVFFLCLLGLLCLLCFCAGRFLV